MSENTPSYFDLEVLAAALRKHSDDLAMYGGFLLNILSSTLPPDLVWVRREGRLRARLAGREPAVLGVSVHTGTYRYELDRAEYGGHAVAKICHQSHGVVLSTRHVSLDEWTSSLAGALVVVAGTNSAAAAALERLTTM